MPVQTFATPASLYAEQVADLSAGGTGYFGAEVVVGGITWKWGGEYYAEAAPGSLTNPFPTPDERNAAYASQLPGGGAGVVGWPAYVDGIGLTTWRGPLATDWDRVALEISPRTHGIAGLGDSITVNYGSIIPWIVAYSGSRLAHVYTTNNGGVSGNTVAQAVLRSDAIISTGIKYLAAQLGTNDVLQSIATATSLAEWDKLKANCDAYGVKLIVIDIPPIGTYLAVDYNAAGKAYTAALKAWCAANNVMNIPAWDTTCGDENGNPVIGNTGLSAADEVHPTAGAYPIAGKRAGEYLIATYGDYLPVPLDDSAIRSSTLVRTLNSKVRIDTNGDGLGDFWLADASVGVRSIVSSGGKLWQSGTNLANGAGGSALRKDLSPYLTGIFLIAGDFVVTPNPAGDKLAIWVEATGALEGSVFSIFNDPILYSPVTIRYVGFVSLPTVPATTRMGFGYNNSAGSNAIRATDIVFGKIK